MEGLNCMFACISKLWAPGLLCSGKGDYVSWIYLPGLWTHSRAMYEHTAACALRCLLHKAHMAPITFRPLPPSGNEANMAHACIFPSTSNISKTLITTLSVYRRNSNHIHNSSWVMYIYWQTLQFISADTSMFLAARSLWTKDLLARYSIPEETWWLSFRQSFGVSGAVISPGLNEIKMRNTGMLGFTH